MYLKPHPAVLLLSLIALAVACGRDVSVTPADVNAADREACARSAEELPEMVAGGKRLTTTPDVQTTAAWGAPAIVWRCGVPAPSTLTADAQLLDVSGTQWFPETLTNGNRFTTVADTPRLEVTVPSDYGNPAGVVAELGAITSDRDDGATPPPPATG